MAGHFQNPYSRWLHREVLSSLRTPHPLNGGSRGRGGGTTAPGVYTTLQIASVREEEGTLMLSDTEHVVEAYLSPALLASLLKEFGLKVFGDLDELRGALVSVKACTLGSLWEDTPKGTFALQPCLHVTDMDFLGGAGNRVIGSPRGLGEDSDTLEALHTLSLDPHALALYARPLEEGEGRLGKRLGLPPHWFGATVTQHFLAQHHHHQQHQQQRGGSGGGGKVGMEEEMEGVEEEREEREEEEGRVREGGKVQLQQSHLPSHTKRVSEQTVPASSSSSSSSPNFFPGPSSSSLPPNPFLGGGRKGDEWEGGKSESNTKKTSASGKQLLSMPSLSATSGAGSSGSSGSSSSSSTSVGGEVKEGVLYGHYRPLELVEEVGEKGGMQTGEGGEEEEEKEEKEEEERGEAWVSKRKLKRVEEFMVEGELRTAWMRGMWGLAFNPGAHSTVKH